MPLFSRFLILILFNTLPTVLYAGETGYEVELIIFEDTTNRYLNSEEWRYNDMLNKKENVLVEKISPNIDAEYEELNWQESKLITEFNRLDNNSRYRILATRRWKQTGLDRKHAFDIPINILDQNIDDNSFSEETMLSQNALTEQENIESNISQLTPDQKETIDLTKPYITGHVKLIMSRYLHFNVDLKYIKPQENNDNDNRYNGGYNNRDNSHAFNQRNEFREMDQTNEIEEPEVTDASEPNSQSVPIVNERRMRSREIHYIDHPLVGIIVLATPYKIKPPEEETTQPAPYKTM